MARPTGSASRRACVDNASDSAAKCRSGDGFFRGEFVDETERAWLLWGLEEARHGIADEAPRSCRGQEKTKRGSAFMLHRLRLESSRVEPAIPSPGPGPGHPSIHPSTDAPPRLPRPRFMPQARPRPRFSLFTAAPSSVLAHQHQRAFSAFFSSPYLAVPDCTARSLTCREAVFRSCPPPLLLFRAFVTTFILDFPPPPHSDHRALLVTISTRDSRFDIPFQSFPPTSSFFPAYQFSAAPLHVGYTDFVFGRVPQHHSCPATYPPTLACAHEGIVIPEEITLGLTSGRVCLPQHLSASAL
ncbi:hypothetical protein Purlil1_7659 [Purpureocillium lilacinum]|uniref:Uncharacterized protein n=1 Tax=Purpureocillium lilacinum TaxID=33203 RepID=A0ABR0BVR4_PURLI|nr:hypothetical protein Purlil1_7659 [Purpureocillium lilacinum]